MLLKLRVTNICFSEQNKKSKKNPFSPITDYVPLKGYLKMSK